MNDILREYYRSKLTKYGDTCLGVDWPNEMDAQTRYRVMLEVCNSWNESLSILDLGCGVGHLVNYLQRNEIQFGEYLGVDVSQESIELCKSKFPEMNFIKFDVISQKLGFSFDYVILNGVLTVKATNSQQTMNRFMESMLLSAFGIAKVGIAFNVMSKQVEWERDDLNHVSLDYISEYVYKNLSRHYVIRQDYGLYEYSVYVYKEPK